MTKPDCGIPCSSFQHTLAQALRFYLLAFSLYAGQKLLGWRRTGGLFGLT